MNKYKFIFSLCFILILCGCSATYEINIKDNKISENLKIIETNKFLFDDKSNSEMSIRESFYSLVNDDEEFSYKDYSIESLNTDEQLGINYKKNDVGAFKDLSMLAQCYKTPMINVKDNAIYIDTGTRFTCYDYYKNIENIQVVINTNHKVLYSNADEENGNRYVWNFDKDSDMRIEIAYKNKKNIVVDKILPTIIIIVSLLVLLVFIYIVINKNKKNNDI